MESKRTKGKWIVRYQSAKAVIKADNGEAESFMWSTVCEISGDGTEGEGKANAEYIVKAVNSYDDLVKALEDIVNLEYETGRSRIYIETIIRTAKAALYKIS